MSYPQFGYTYPAAAAAAASSLSASSQLLVSGSTPTTSTSTSCCEGGRPIMTDPHTGQTVCSCQYSSSLLSYPRVAGLPDSVYSSAYAAQGYMPFATDPSAFYSPLDNSDAWRSLAQPTPCYPYDPMTAGYAYGQSALAQRKNATREATSTLKAWLQEHIKNPYPTKGEKIMLAIITKMTLTQVSTWFANARRRLKKENKMTWSPRNRTDDDDRKLDSDDEDVDGDLKDNNNDKDCDVKSKKADEDDEINIETACDDITVSDDESSLLDPLSSRLGGKPGDPFMPSFSSSCQQPLSAPSRSANMGCMGVSPTKVEPTPPPSNTTNNQQKPRIWSLADVATSGSTNKDSSHPVLGGSHLLAPHPHPHPPTLPPQSHPHPHAPMPSLPQPQHPPPPPHHNPATGGESGNHLSPVKPTDNSSYTPTASVNGFRPWVNGSSGTFPGAGTGQSAPGSAGGALLRPYALAARAEVH